MKRFNYNKLTLLIKKTINLFMKNFIHYKDYIILLMKILDLMKLKPEEKVLIFKN